MKKLALVTLLSFLLTTTLSPLQAGAQPNKTNEGQAPVTSSLNRPQQKNITENTTVTDSVYSYFDKNSSYYGLSGAAEASLSVVESFNDSELNVQAVKLKQNYKGIPVYGSVQIVHLDSKGNVKDVIGSLVTNVEDHIKGESLKQVLKKEKALEIAKKDLKDKPKEFKESTSELNIYNYKNKPELVYVVNLSYSQPEPARWVYFVDAHSGKIVDKYNGLTYSNATGTGKGVLGDTKTLNIDFDSSTQLYHLQDNTRGAKIYTYDEKNKTESSLKLPGVLWYDVDNKFNNIYDAPAVDAHYYAGLVYNYYKIIHGRNSYDNLGGSIHSSVHYSSNYNNAYWDGYQMVYGDGDGKKYTSLSGALDVVGHELTHAVTEYSAGLIYRNESGAINEALSDIFGTLIEYYSNRNPDWEIGEDVYTPATPGDALRSLSNPKKYDNPDHYSDRYTGSDDNGGVHTNSGIINKAAYLISQGGTHYGVAVNGIGRDKLGKILYRTLTRYLVPTSDFLALRYGSIQAAADLYGAASAEVTTVKNAFKAVGIVEPAGVQTLSVNTSKFGSFSKKDDIQLFKLNPSTVIASSSHISLKVYNTSANITVYQDYNSFLRGKSVEQYTNKLNSVDFPISWSGDIYIKLQSTASGSFELSNKGTYKEPQQHPENCSLELTGSQDASIKNLLPGLRDFRDKMNKTQLGKSLSSLYYSISLQIVDNLMVDSRFRSDFKKDILKLNKLFTELNKNSNYIISEQDYTAILGLKEAIEAKVSSETKDTINKYWAELKVDSIAGHKLNDYLLSHKLIKPANVHSVIVKTKNTVSLSQATSLMKQAITAQGLQAGINKVASLGLDSVSLPNTYVVDVTTSESINKVVQSLKKQPDIEYVQQSYTGKTLGADVQYKSQWSLKNSGQNGGNVGSDINYETMIARLGSTQYDKTMIAVLDTGINYELRDFYGIVRTDIDRDFVNMDYDAADDYYHGTHVSGIIAASYNNSYSISGINKHASLLPVKVANHEGTCSDITVAQGIKYAVDKGAKVINLSLSFGQISSIPIIDDQLQYANSRGVTVIASAGNDGYSKVDYPAVSQYVISVGATDKYDSLWGSSNRGYSLDLVAPGVDIPSLVNYGEVELLTGTSMAAPHVAGVVGLLYSLKPGITPSQVEEVLRTSCKDLGSAGPDYYYGWGRLDAGAAVAKVKSNVPLPKVNAVYDNSTKVTGTSTAGYKIIVRNSSNVQLGYASAGTDGKFSVNIPVQKADTYVKVFAVNSSGVSSYATYVKVVDKTPPVVPTIDTLTTSSTVIKGKTEAYAKVNIYINNVYRSQVTASSTGAYQYTTTPQKVGTSVKAAAIDKYGNTSASTTVKVNYPAPTINTVTTKSTTISGKTLPSLSVSLYIKGVYKGKVTADKYGAYKFTITPAAVGSEIKVTASDSKLNTSVTAITKVVN
jgi:Zn-dependent metalloprotease